MCPRNLHTITLPISNLMYGTPRHFLGSSPGGKLNDTSSEAWYDKRWLHAFVSPFPKKVVPHCQVYLRLVLGGHDQCVCFTDHYSPLCPLCWIIPSPPQLFFSASFQLSDPQRHWGTHLWMWWRRVSSEAIFWAIAEGILLRFHPSLRLQNPIISDLF